MQLRLLVATKITNIDGRDDGPNTPQAWTTRNGGQRTKASCVPRSDVVGAQPLRPGWTVGRRARVFSLVARAPENEMREEPGCETLLVPSQVPQRPE